MDQPPHRLLEALYFYGNIPSSRPLQDNAKQATFRYARRAHFH